MLRAEKIRDVSYFNNHLRKQTVMRTGAQMTSPLQ